MVLFTACKICSSSVARIQDEAVAKKQNIVEEKKKEKKESDRVTI